MLSSHGDFSRLARDENSNVALSASEDDEDSFSHRSQDRLKPIGFDQIFQILQLALKEVDRAAMFDASAWDERKLITLKQ